MTVRREARNGRNCINPSRHRTSWFAFMQNRIVSGDSRLGKRCVYFHVDVRR